MIFADLHMHTAYSDGIHSIEEVVKFTKEKGIHTLAITDHDTIFHFDKVKRICERYGVETVRGVEMSCYDKDVYKKVHIIGLWLGANPIHVGALCKETLKCRDAYHHKLIAELNQKGFDITYEEAKSFAPYNIVFKMHIFMAIVHKYPEYNNINKYRELFAGKTSKETDAQMGYSDIKEGIEAIRQDGGIAILAHPCEYDNYDEIEKYIGYGLQGIEISHPSMKEADYPLTQEFASRYHILKSGGSDFHKSTSVLGKYGLTEEEFHELEQEVTKSLG